MIVYGYAPSDTRLSGQGRLVARRLGCRSIVFALLAAIALVVAGPAPAPAAEAPFPEGVAARDLGCFMIMAGKDATVDGSVLIAHNNDLTGAEASLVEKTAAADHSSQCRISFPTGLEIPQAAHTFSMLVLRIHTGYAQGDAIAINEHQVAIGGGVALRADRNERAAQADPLVKRGLTGGIRYAALQRCRTARECVEWIGAMYTEHGVSYPSGVAIADPNEIWYLEAGGGRSWAAVRIPDDAVWVQANAYRIGEIDPRNDANTLASPGLLDFAEEQGLWNPDDGPFHFARAFGKESLLPDDAGSNRTRVWRGIRLVDRAQELTCVTRDLPLFLVPDEKLTVDRLIEILRDRYDGVAAEIEATSGRPQRPIATSRTVHTDVVQLRSWLPADIGAVLWLGLSASSCTTYLPFYFGIDRVPDPFSIAGATYQPDSAFWRFRSITNLVTPYFDHVINDVREVTDAFESRIFAARSRFEAEAIRVHATNPQEARRLLTDATSAHAAACLEMARKLEAHLQKTIAAHAFEW